MSTVPGPPAFPCRSLAAGLLVLTATCGILRVNGQQPPSVPPPAPLTDLHTAAPAVGFFTSRTVLWLGRTQVIPIRTTEPAASELTFAATLADPSTVEILRPPVVLDGDSVGFIRVRGVKIGRTKLTIHGDAVLDIEVKVDPAGTAFAPIDEESTRPRIVSPMPDACVWGEFAVGVEVFDGAVRATASDLSHPDAPAATASSGGVKVQLKLPDGRLLDPVEKSGPELGPQRRYQFSVRAEDFPPGPISLVAVSTPEGISDVDRRSGRAGAVLESDPLVVRDFRPQAGMFWAGECENPAIMGETRELLAPGRIAAEHLGTKQPEVGPDPAASGGQNVRLPSNNDAWCLPFIVHSAGEYQMFLQARGDFAGGAFPSIAMFSDGSESPVGGVRLSGTKYHRVPVGAPIRLDAGPQQLAFVFRNDFSHGKEDRNLYLDRFEIARVGDLPPPPPPVPEKKPVGPAPTTAGNGAPSNLALPSATVSQASSLPTPPEAAPRIAILYPAAGASIFGADAVVARVSGGVGRPPWVDIVIDGQPQGVRSPGASNGSEALVFPIVARQLTPGRHQLLVRAADSSGHTTDSPAQPLVVLARAPFMPGRYERAVFLLDRLAFGPEPRELAAVLTLGETAWLNNRLAASFETAPEQAVLHMASRKYPRIDDAHQTTSRALAQWIASDNPVRSRFTAWAENHFSTWIEKTKPAPKWHEHLDFCRIGVAPFVDLLSASSHSAAMLAYLDQEKSYAGKLNENYAREIMELHTLGVHGGYKQADVTALAGVLNGWTTAREAIMPQEDEPLKLVYNGGNESGTWYDFRFDPLLNDGKSRRVFGLEFAATNDPAVRFDNIRFAMEMLAAHPSTADHVCRKLAEHYVGVPASDTLVHALAQSYLENGGDMRAVMRTMVAQPDFWNAPLKMATPFDFGMRVARLCRAAVAQTVNDPEQQPNAEAIENFLKKSGMGLFDRVTPDGYPENSSNYADSNALLQRWRFMQTITEPLNRLVPNGWRTPPASVVPAANETQGDSPGMSVQFDPGQRFIDLAAVRLTGHLLDPKSNQSALDVLGEGRPDQMRQTILFVSLLPETSLR